MSFLNEGLIYRLVFPENWQLYTVQIVFALLTIIIAYTLGSLNSAIIVSRLFYGEDIRTRGSGNAGLTNILRSYGKRAAVFVLMGDMLKTALAILVCAVFFGFHYNHGISLDDGYCYMAGLFAVLGHVFPVFYEFKGGKGVLVTATMALILTPIPFTFLLFVFIAVVAMSKFVSLGSVVVAVLYPVVVNGYIKFVFNSSSPGILSLCTIILAIFIVWCHRTNLVRISNGTENKLSFGNKNKKDKDE